jgi:hypothetical protein
LILPHGARYDAAVTEMARAFVNGLWSAGGWVLWGRSLLEGTLGMWLAGPAVLLLPARGVADEAPGAMHRSDAWGEDAKYDLGEAPRGPRLANPEEREAGELPSAYGVDRLTLLARDPWCIFAYWEVTPGRREPALEALGREAEGACQVLRLYAHGADGDATVDVELPVDLGSRYLSVASPGASCRAEIGLSAPSGRFVPLVSSNTVRMPSAAPSNDTSLVWDMVARMPVR